tara:strand:+ start:11943 stop:13292 length:1350 start_codon:yes stop_codon:yes gene_type:complete
LKIIKKLNSILIEKIGLRGQDEKLLISGSANIIIIKIFGLLIGFGVQILLARVMGVNEYGDYIYVLTWINLVGLFSKFGFDSASKKFLPILYTQENWSGLFGYVRYTSKFVFITGLLFVLTSVLSAYFFDRNQLSLIFLAGAFVLLINNQLGLFSSFLEAIREFYKSLIPTNIIRPLGIVLGVVIYYIVSESVKSEYVMYINAVSTLFALVIAYGWLKSSTKSPDESISTTIDDKKEWRNISYSLLLVSGIHIVLNEMDTIILGILISTESAGVYKSAIKIGHLALFGFNAVELVIAPTIAKLYAENDSIGIQQIVSKGVLIMMAVSFPLLIFLWFFGGSILLLYGPEFLIGFTSMKILLVCQVINVITGSVINLMTMTKYQKETLYVFSMSLVFNLVLNLVLIPIYGMEGAAWATGITTIVWNITALLFIRKKLKVDPSIFHYFKKTI